ncbi:MAG: hypothetical protein R2843_05750 [Thermomicrobiales bacterium]
MRAKQADIALVFGSEPDPSQPLSVFAEEMHRVGMSSSDVIAGRRAEEAAASVILGTSDRFLPFHDAIYRGFNYLNNDQLFARPVDAEAGLPAAIADSLELDGFRQELGALVRTPLRAASTSIISTCSMPARSWQDKASTSGSMRICPIR